MFDLDKYLEYLYVIGELDNIDDYNKQDNNEDEEEEEDFDLDTKHYPRLRTR